MTHQDEHASNPPAAPHAASNHADPAAGPSPDGQPRKRRRRRRRGRKPDGQGGPAPEAGATATAIDPMEDDGPDDADEGDAMDAPFTPAPAHVPHVPALDAHAGGPKPKVQDIFDEVISFADLGLRNSVLRGVEACGFKRPTKVQAQIIPVVIQGRDVLGQAKTGSGKTAAFGLPLFHMATRGLPFQSVVLVPTRELAQQVAGELAELGQFTPIKTSAVYGGESIQTQSRNLEQGPEIIVATPGRLMDMLERGRLHLNNVKFVVLDEVDRMLDIGFRDDIRKILGGVRHDHRTIFVSATISDEIETLARKHMRDPVKLVTTAGSLTVSLVEQHYLAVAPWDKRRLLTHLLTHEEPALTVVFCRTKRTVDNVAEHLHKHNIDVQAIHGDMQQGRRNRVMSQLRGGKLAVLIASDLAARGLDVEDISHVINYDLPEDPEVYIHRIGRTARAGRGGIAWSLVTPDQGELLTAIEKLANIEIPKMDYPDFQASPQPEGFGDRGRGGPRGGFGGGGRGGPPRGGPRRDDRGPRPEQAQAGAPRADGAGHGGGHGGGSGSGGGHGGSGGGGSGGGGGYGAPPAPAPRAPAAQTAQSSGRPLPTKDNPTRFPGGLKPTKMPPRVMGGKVKTSRSGRGQTPD